MEKRGASQIDWAISIGVFIIFLTIFVILVHPLVSQRPLQISNLDNVVEKFTKAGEPNTIVWSINKVPIYFDSSLDETRSVSIEFPHNWKTENTSFTDKRAFLIDENRIFFFHQLNVSEAWLVNSDFNYTQNSTPAIDCDATRAETASLELDILNGELQAIGYNGNEMASNIDLDVSGAATFSDKSFICKYTKGAHDFYVMDDSVIFNYFDSGPVKLEMDLPDDYYDYYYDGSAHSVPYDGNCTTRNGIGMIDFYDSDGIAFASDGLNATFCSRNESGTLKLNLSLEFKNPYKIILHDGNYINASEYADTKIGLGLAQALEGLSYDKLAELNDSRHTDYSRLKQDWGIAQINDFDFRISNKT
jgi:hypothetical protein